jgi:putative CocE/NonD family hydrolase
MVHVAGGGSALCGRRPDVLTWQTQELKEDITLAGAVTAKLFASTTGSDSDWIVKLIDVYPEKYPEKWQLSGYELMIADEVFRGRFRKSFEKPEPIAPGTVTPFPVDLHTSNHVFKKGHRIMVQVQSTWFPIIDRNPQKFVPNIFEAKESDFQKATQRIYRSQQYPSGVEIAVLP